MTDYITIRHAAILNNVSESTIRAAIDRGNLKYRQCECSKTTLVESVPVVLIQRGRPRGSKNRIRPGVCLQ